MSSLPVSVYLSRLCVYLLLPNVTTPVSLPSCTYTPPLLPHVLCQMVVFRIPLISQCFRAVVEPD